MTAVQTPATTQTPSTLEVVNPATGAVVETIPVDTAASVTAKLQHARKVFPSWADTPAEERVRVLFDAAALIRRNAEELANALVVEGGQIIAEADFEIQGLATTFEFYAGVARHHAGSVVPSQSLTMDNFVRRDPVGVIAAVVPWNYPLTLWGWKAAPALAGGNVVVAKSSPETPLSLLKVQELLVEAGLPEGVHQVVVGGSDVGEALVGSPLVDGIAFTGSVPAGKQILKAAAENLTTICTLELSGHDPFIVADDADVDLAAELLVFNAFLHAGQICTSSERAYVPAATFEQFTAKVVEQASAIRLGDPLSYGTDMGPVMNRTQVKRLEAYVERARKLGATIHTGGGVAPDHGDLYFEPTVISGLSHEQLTDMGEVFGPIIPIVAVDSFEQALEFANDSPMGLGACVVTESLKRAMLASRVLRFGSVWINSDTRDTLGGPFGGFRQSGQGRELGIEGYDAFLQPKHVSLEHTLVPSPLWFGRREG